MYTIVYRELIGSQLGRNQGPYTRPSVPTLFAWFRECLRTRVQVLSNGQLHLVIYGGQRPMDFRAEIDRVFPRILYEKCRQKR